MDGLDDDPMKDGLVDAWKALFIEFEGARAGHKQVQWKACAAESERD
jgi:hypothetical protein